MRRVAQPLHGVSLRRTPRRWSERKPRQNGAPVAITVLAHVELREGVLQTLPVPHVAEVHPIAGLVLPSIQRTYVSQQSDGTNTNHTLEGEATGYCSEPTSRDDANLTSRIRRKRSHAAYTCALPDGCSAQHQ